MRWHVLKKTKQPIVIVMRLRAQLAKLRTQLLTEGGKGGGGGKGEGFEVAKVGMGV